MLFLQLCCSLQYFTFSDDSITFEDLIGSDISYNSSSNKQQATTAAAGMTQQFIRPWACEDTLQTLKLSLDMSDAPLQEQHTLVWKHLGRFKKLRSLTFAHPSSPLGQGRCGLIPSFDYGLKGLLTGGRLSETLTEIRSLPSWWKVEDRRGMVLWFAKSFPNLVVLALMHYGEEIKGGSVGNFIAFLEDEDVKRCSIYRIFIESR